MFEQSYPEIVFRDDADYKRFVSYYAKNQEFWEHNKELAYEKINKTEIDRLFNE